MQKRTKVMIGMVLALLLALSIVPYAIADGVAGKGNFGSNCGQYCQKNGQAAAAGACQQLTEEQKQQLQPLWEQMASVHKQMIQKRVELGLINQAQADRMLERVEQRLKNQQENGCSRFGGLRGGMGRGQCPVLNGQNAQ